MSGPPPARTIGIDVGGTKTALCVADFPEGRIVERRLLDTSLDPADAAPFLDRVVAAAAGLHDAAAAGGVRCSAIGLSVCELVDLSGDIASTHRLRWRDLPVRTKLRALLPAVVESDVRAAALAEARFGGGRDYRQFLYGNIGTGVSSAWVCDGRPHAGARGNALVLASSPVSFTCPHCGKDGAYVPEDVAGGGGLARALGAASARDVLTAAEQGDAAAKRAIAAATRALGVNLGLAVNILDPEAVVIGGGLGRAGGLYWDGLVASTRAHIWSEATRDLPIRPAALGDDSGLLGAAACAWLTTGSPAPP
jgi:glucokinase